MAMAVVVDLSTEMASVALLHSSCSGDGSVDRDGVSVTIAVELARLATVVVVDTTVVVSDIRRQRQRW